MKLLPFDLQLALAGDKVVTRGGAEVTQLTKFDCKTSLTVAGVMNGAIYMWEVDGSYISKKTEFDIFMAPKTVKRWVNFYSDGTTISFDSKESAKEVNCWHSKPIAIAVPVEFEEGYGCE